MSAEHVANASFEVNAETFERWLRTYLARIICKRTLPGLTLLPSDGLPVKRYILAARLQSGEIFYLEDLVPRQETTPRFRATEEPGIDLPFGREFYMQLLVCVPNVYGVMGAPPAIIIDHDKPAFELRFVPHNEGMLRIAIVGGEPRFHSLYQEIIAAIEYEFPGARVSDHDVSAEDELTSREREVAGFISQGMSTKQVADQLVLSASTVKAHKRSIAKKWNCSSSDQVLRLEAQKRGYS